MVESLEISDGDGVTVSYARLWRGNDGFWGDSAKCDTWMRVDNCSGGRGTRRDGQQDNKGNRRELEDYTNVD